MTTLPDMAALKRIRLAVFSFYFTQGLCFSSWASRIPDIKDSLGMDDAAWGTILLMIPIGQVCGMSLSGLLVSRLGSRRILSVANIAYALMLILVGFTQSEYSLMMSLIVFGFFGNFCNISQNTQSVGIERMYGRPIMASFHGGWSLAGLAGAAFGLFMSSQHIQPAYHFGTVAVLVMANYVVNQKYLQPDIKREKTLEELAEKKKFKPEKFLYLLGIVAFFGMAAEGSMSDWNGLYLQEIVGVAKEYAPLGLTAYMLTMSTGRFFADRASQKYGQLRVVQGGGALIAIGLLTSVIFPNIIVTLIAFMIVGLGTCSIVPTVYSIAGQKTKISIGLALTLVSSISFMGFLLGPPIIGYVAHATNLRYSYALIALFGICIVFMSSRMNVFRK